MDNIGLQGEQLAVQLLVQVSKTSSALCKTLHITDT